MSIFIVICIYGLCHVAVRQRYLSLNICRKTEIHIVEKRKITA